MKDKRQKSYIPKESEALEIAPAVQEEFTWPDSTPEIRLVHAQVIVYRYQGRIVGRRGYDAEGRVIYEQPLKDGLLHGICYTWEESGLRRTPVGSGCKPWLMLVEPYCEGKSHGTAYQYAEDGSLMGTYTLVHGTGFDVWRQFREDGSIYVSEIHGLQNGIPHGFELWLNEDQTLSAERHWKNGEVHGVQRDWNFQGRVRRGWPCYYVESERLTKRRYVNLSQSDPTLPPFREEDNLPVRSFPRDIRRILNSM